MALLTTGLCFIIAVPLLLCGIADYSVMFHNSCTIVVVVALLIIAFMFHHSCTIFVLWHC